MFLAFVDTHDWDQKYVQKMFTEVINQVGSTVVFLYDFRWSRPLLARTDNSAFKGFVHWQSVHFFHTVYVVNIYPRLRHYRCHFLSGNELVFWLARAAVWPWMRGMWLAGRRRAGARALCRRQCWEQGFCRHKFMRTYTHQDTTSCPKKILIEPPGSSGKGLGQSTGTNTHRWRVQPDSEAECWVIFLWGERSRSSGVEGRCIIWIY